ncbi:DUF2255 family protein [Apilactobacillus timberlakei]|jgi:hypothetical protein|uniref:DUF2255 family protein n=1 Tax=Apilactobacillus timberlakei TaxID=2008380 RepID=UPI001127E98C|nr:DUF2255 family protein [Apilactobacillus timberlakei]TPR13247.1 DUF2255 family protein [Apilactobacillus timberlakei]
MKQWTKEQLKNFSTADDMHVSPFYDDGKTYGTPTWIWSVVSNNKLYVRAYNGQKSRWYQSAMKQHAGKIKLAGQEYKVSFNNAAGNKNLDNQINEAYKNKYGDSPYCQPMLQSGPISATVEIEPK